jgi:hypothetical protein
MSTMPAATQAPDTTCWGDSTSGFDRKRHHRRLCLPLLCALQFDELRELRLTSLHSKHALEWMDDMDTDNERDLAVGDLAPDFRLPASDGREITLSAYRGKAHVVLFFVRAYG